MPAKINNATKQAKTQARAGRGGVVPPVNRQFGKPGGNPRHNGAWKKEETARGKFEQWIKMTEEELRDLEKNQNLSAFDESVVNLILQIRRMVKLLEDLVDKLDKEEDVEKRVKLSTYCTSQLEQIMVMLEKLTNQIYGYPKQAVETMTLTPPPALSPRKQKGAKS